MPTQENSDTVGQINGFLTFVGVEKNDTRRFASDRVFGGRLFENDHYDQSQLLVSAKHYRIAPAT